MTKPGVPETSDNVQAAAHSQGDPDPLHETESAGAGGSDVGGPPTSGESATEDALTGTSTVGADDDPDDQAANPL
jgi:hypothetical protein